MSNLATFQASSLSRSLSQQREIERITQAAMEATADLHEFAVKEVRSTLDQAARIMPRELTPGQIGEWKGVTHDYLSRINSIGNTASQRILQAVDEILQLPASR